MITELACCCYCSKLPISILEFENWTGVSFVSNMTEETTDVDTGLVSGGATITDASSANSTSSSTVLTLTKDGKTIWNGITEYSVQEVYLADIVERLDKEVIRRMGKMISKEIFPNQKFIPNWTSCLTLSHDLTQDLEEKDGGWAHHLFNKMNWQLDTYQKPFHQAIKWNTYKNAFIHNFNNYRATNIAKMKKHVMGGK